MANEERIRKNREREEERLRVMEIERLQEDLERKQWEWARDIRSPSPRRLRTSRREPEEVLYLDGRREFPTTEVFGGPRGDYQQRPGTSSGSRLSGPRLTDIRYRLPSSKDKEEVQRKEDRDEESGRGPPEIGE